MEERRHFKGSGGIQPLTAIDLVDLDKLALFRYCVVTWIDKDGFPFSVATDFLLSENGEILLKKPNVPATITGSRVGVLFNHITGIPTGGYTDRRYMLVWGNVSEDKGFLKLHPEELSEWDEKILPFDKLCAAAAPQGKKYLENLQPSIEA
jgi:1,4-dihydroxy-2-naphthoate octaprenyltransferase